MKEIFILIFDVSQKEAAFSKGNLFLVDVFLQPKDDGKKMDLYWLFL